MTIRPVWAIAALTMAGAVLAGCAGAPTRFYTLDPVAPPGPGQANAYAGPPLRVDVVHIPAAYDRTELVAEFAAGRIVVGDNDHWAAPLGDLIRGALTQDLVARLPAGSMIYPGSPKPAGASGLTVDILAISRDGSSVVMDLSWTVTLAQGDGKRAAPPRTLQYRGRLSAPATDTGLAGSPAELSELLGKAADQIAADLAR